MEFDSLLSLIGNEPVFESFLLLSGDVDPKGIRLQLSRWVKRGKIYQLRRGVYCVAPPYQKVKPHPFVVANYLQQASYVSLQSALSHYGLIPEIVNTTTSISTGRPERVETPLGVFEFHHVKTQLLFGYQMIDLGGQEALVATPEKALLDLIYLQSMGETPAYLKELRLQNIERLDLEVLRKQAEKFNTPKMRIAVKNLSQVTFGDTDAYEDL
jgi:predicted transcriptional regulator of viral defense system